MTYARWKISGLIVLAAMFSASATARQAEPQDAAEEMSERAAKVEVLRDGLAHLPAEDIASLDVYRVRFEDVLFPGDDRELSEIEHLPRESYFPLVARAEVESWYSRQVGELFVGRNYRETDEVRVLYLPACGGAWRDVRQRIAEQVLSDVDVPRGYFQPWQFDVAAISRAAEGEGIPTDGWLEPDRPGSQVDDLPLDDKGGLTPEAMLAINRELLARQETGDGEETAAPFIVLQKYCTKLFPKGFNFTGVIGGFHPPSASPSAPSPRYYYVDLPDGMADAKLLRGVVAIVCNARNKPLHSQQCEGTSAFENKPVMRVASGKHWFVGKIDGVWVEGVFRPEEQYLLTNLPPPLQPGQTPQSMGIYPVPLVPLAE